MTAYDKLIKKLAGENDGPVFKPHITLLGNIELSEDEVIKRTKRLVLGQKPFQVNLGEIDYENYHYLHELAKQIFKMEAPPY